MKKALSIALVTFSVSVYAQSLYPSYEFNKSSPSFLVGIRVDSTDQVGEELEYYIVSFESVREFNKRFKNMKNVIEREYSSGFWTCVKEEEGFLIKKLWVPLGGRADFNVRPIDY